MTLQHEVWIYEALTCASLMMVGLTIAKGNILLPLICLLIAMLTLGKYSELISQGRVIPYWKYYYRIWRKKNGK